MKRGDYQDESKKEERNEGRVRVKKDMTGWLSVSLTTACLFLQCAAAASQSPISYAMLFYMSSLSLLLL